MGGEKILEPSMGVGNFGSPPRGRGKAIGVDLHHPEVGITPAWAGKSATSVRARATTRDHPRVDGEKILEPSMGVGNFGSPPRGRGKARHLSHGLLPCG